MDRKVIIIDKNRIGLFDLRRKNMKINNKSLLRSGKEKNKCKNMKEY